MGLATLRVSAELLVEMCKSEKVQTVQVTQHRVPSDAQIKDVYFAPTTQPERMLMILLESKSFPDRAYPYPELPSVEFARIEKGT